MKEEIFKEELKGFNINIDDIKPDNDMFGAIEKAIVRMNNEFYINNLEVVLNNNLIEVKNKFNGCRTILGCRVSYMDLAESVSFIVREDTKPSYEQLQQENKELKERIDVYENPDDLTLMFMYCDEKAKDKIKELKKDLEYVLNQVLGAFEKNDCIDWNFTEIREKYNFKGDK